MGIPRSVHSAIFGDDEEDPDINLGPADHGIDKYPAIPSGGSNTGLEGEGDGIDQNAKRGAVNAMSIEFGNGDNEASDQQAGDEGAGLSDPHLWDNLWKYLTAKAANKKKSGGGGMMGGGGGMDMGSMMGGIGGGGGGA